MKSIILTALLIAASAVGCTHKPVIENVTIEGPYKTIPAEIQKPSCRAGEKLPLVIICHGLTGNRDEMHLTSLADSLQNLGIASIRFDFNGHNADTANFVHHCISKEINEALAVYNYVSSLPWVDEKRIGLTGHSQGGYVAGCTAGELGSSKIACLALLAPAASIHYRSLKGLTSKGVPFDVSKLDSLITNAAADPQAPQGIEYKKGRMLGWQYLKDAMEIDPHKMAERYDGPTIIVQGTKDSPFLFEKSKEYLEYMPQAQFIELEGLTHCYRENYGLAAKTSADFFCRQLCK